MVGVFQGGVGWLLALSTVVAVAAGCVGEAPPASAPQAAPPAPEGEAPPSDGSASPLQWPGLPTLTSSGWGIVSTKSYPSHTSSGASAGNVSWRLVSGIGNCCENYIAATSAGRLVNHGGSYLMQSDDEGATWTRIAPPVPLVGGEGAVTSAPGGDILSVVWDLTAGDRLQAFRYDAATDVWEYAEAPLHGPVFDRPWIAVVPGPFTVGPLTVEYVSVVRGGASPTDEAAYYVSLDGLHYTLPSSAPLDARLKSAVTAALSPAAYADGDWTQPHVRAHVTPLGGGKAVSRSGLPPTAGCAWRILQPNLAWACHTPTSPLAGADYLADSDGRLHRLDMNAMTYAISTNGGSTWSSTSFSLPSGMTLEEWDYKTNAELGITAVAVHAHKTGDSKDTDLVYKFNVTTNTPSLTRRYQVGDGDLDASAGLDAVRATGSDRFDFTSVAILPSGHIAVSFIDNAHRIAVAIQQ